MTESRDQELADLKRRLDRALERCRGLEAAGGEGGDDEVRELRARVRELTADLQASRHFLSAIRGHVEALFGSRRWRIGSWLVDLFLRLRRRERPPTAEDHLRSLYRDVDQWLVGRRAAGVSPAARSTSPPVARARARAPEERRELLFFRLVDDVLRSAGVEAVVRAFEDSEDCLLAHLEATAPARTPLVSVILPTYDRAHVLHEAIRSVREQSYTEWELIVSDDGSTDGTKELVAQFDDPRIRYLFGENAGAAAARNRALRVARGELVAYLDSDNVWHPDHLAAFVGALEGHPGHHCAYGRYLDVIVEDDGYRVKRYEAPPFDYESLTVKNTIDLNIFVHRRDLFEALGGFDERLRRQQDWDLVLGYTFLRDPLFVDSFLVLYRRNSAWDQITERERENPETAEIIAETVERHHQEGLTVALSTPRPSVSVISWDICRNHFSKAYNLAEALSRDRDVELVGFRFFEDEIFPPYARERPTFETRYFPGSEFPAFYGQIRRALTSLRGDVVYAVKPRLPSLGLALLANFHFGKPVVLEINDLESEVANPVAGGATPPLEIDSLRSDDPRLVDPHHTLWSRLLENLAPTLPAQVTHNANLDRRFGESSHQVRNLKDETHFDPSLYSRERLRRRLGLAADDRVLLFGGMVRRHKGVFALLEFLERLGDSRYKLLVVNSRETPDSRELERSAGDRLVMLAAQGRNAMAEVNRAADLTVLWLDPEVPASHYQMPYKLTDAMAMELPVIANPISDLASLGQAGCLRLVEYGDFEGLGAAIEGLFAHPEETREMVRRARRLYLRQFGYRAARASLELILRRHSGSTEVLPAARRFESFFAEFYRSTSDTATERS